MSKLESALVQIRDVIQNSSYFKDMPVYFDDSEMNPNIKLPAISFKVGSVEVEDPNPTCTTYRRSIEIRLHTKELDKRRLQSQLYDYEEQMIEVINNARIVGDFDFEIALEGCDGIAALLWNARKDGTTRSNTFFSNILRMRFNLGVTI